MIAATESFLLSALLTLRAAPSAERNVFSYPLPGVPKLRSSRANLIRAGNSQHKPQAPSIRLRRTQDGRGTPTTGIVQTALCNFAFPIGERLWPVRRLNLNFSIEIGCVLLGKVGCCATRTNVINKQLFFGGERDCPGELRFQVIGREGFLSGTACTDQQQKNRREPSRHAASWMQQVLTMFAGYHSRAVFADAIRECR